MDRRRFISAFAGAVASVAIGLKLSQGMPAFDGISLRSIKHPHNPTSNLWQNPDLSEASLETMMAEFHEDGTITVTPI